jgi:hypothetical protein
MSLLEFVIGDAGERIVNDYFVRQGYSTNLDTRAPGSTDIEVKYNNSIVYLVQVKTAKAPGDPADLSPNELSNITSRAARLGAKALLARVVVDASFELIGDINFEEL